MTDWSQFTLDEEAPSIDWSQFALEEDAKSGSFDYRKSFEQYPGGDAPVLDGASMQATPLPEPEPKPAAPAAERSAPTPYAKARTKDELFGLLQDAIADGAPQSSVLDVLKAAKIPEQEFRSWFDKMQGGSGEAFYPEPRAVRDAAGAPPGPTGVATPDNPGFVEDVANIARRGISKAGMVGDVLGGEAARAMGWNVDDSTARNVRKRLIDESNAPMSMELQDKLDELMRGVESDKTFSGAARAIMENPTATAALVAESLVSSSPSILAATIGMAAGGPITAAGAAGIASFAQEYAHTIIGTMQERGVDPSDVAQFTKAWQDPEIMSEAREKGAKRGIAVGVFDALSAGVAGKLVAPVAKALAAGKITAAEASKKMLPRVVGEGVTQAGFGAFGEHAAQKWVGEDKKFDVLLEGIAEVPGSAPEVAAGVYHRMNAGASPAGPRLTGNPDLDAIYEAGARARAQEAAGATNAPPPATDTTQTTSAPPAPASQASAPVAPDAPAANVPPVTAQEPGAAGTPQSGAGVPDRGATVIQSPEAAEAGLPPLILPEAGAGLLAKLDQAAAEASGAETSAAAPEGATISAPILTPEGGDVATVQTKQAPAGPAVQRGTTAGTPQAGQVPGAAPSPALGESVGEGRVDGTQSAGVQPVAREAKPLSEPELQQDRDFALAADAELQARAAQIERDKGAPPPRLTPSSQPGAQEMAQAWSDATGFTRPIMFHDPASDVGGMYYKGRMWVNTASPTGSLYVAGHESFHEIERAAESGDAEATRILGAFRAAALPLISRKGRHEYGKQHLFASRIAAAVEQARAEGKDTLAARVAAEKAAMASTELDSELGADAVAQVIARDPQKFFKNLQKQAPEQFGPVVTKLLGIVRKFKSALAKRMNLGAKDVVKHIRDLDRFESEVTKMLADWKRSRTPQVTQQVAPQATPQAEGDVQESGAFTKREQAAEAEQGEDSLSSEEQAAIEEELADELADEDYTEEPPLKWSADPKTKKPTAADEKQENGDALTKIDPKPSKIKLSDDAYELSALSMLYGPGRKGHDKRSVRAVGAELHERAVKKLNEMGIPVGDLTDERMIDLASDVIAAEIEVALRKPGNAATWHSEKIKGTMAVAGLIHPELQTSAKHRVAFLIATAIASQNMAVPDNLAHAEKMYAGWKSTGRFDEESGWGTAAKSMKRSFARANRLMEEYAPERVERFLNSTFTVGELDAAGWGVSGEKKETVVYGSAIFGPKIGNGFFQNISGNFDPLTMDMWFMRGIGRIVGDLINGDPTLFAGQRKRLLDALNDGSYGWANIVPSDDFTEDTGITAFTEELLRENEDALIDFAKRIVASFDKVYKAHKDDFIAGGRTKPELVLASGSILGAGATKDVPASGGHRDNLRAIFQRALDKLADAGVELTSADGQAIWWFPEKDLYSTLGAGNKKSAPTDYEREIIEIAKKRGISERKIENAIARSRRGDRGAGPEEAEGSDRPSLSRRERQQFLRQRVLAALRPSAGSYGRADQGPKGSRASVGSTHFNHKGFWQVEQKTKNLLAKVGIPSPGFFEVDSAAAFKGAIEQAKAALPGGSSVYVYEESEYEQMRLFLAPGGKTGFALKGDDIVSVFDADPNAKGVANAALMLATQLGGRRLDAFDVGLPEIYSLNGFQAAARLSWNDEHSPEGWDKTRYGEFNNGEPDVVYMAYNPANARLYKPGDGRRYQSDTQAIAAQSRAVAAPAAPAAGPKFSIDPARSPEPAGRSGDGRAEGAGGGVPAERGWSKRTPRPGSVSVDGWHYSHAKTPVLSGSKYGEGIRGRERDRIDRATDPRIKRRVYFYIPKGDGSLPGKEQGLGPHRYDARLSNLYDPSTLDPRVKRIAEGADAFESSVLDAGYDGYLAKNFGMAIVLDADVPVGAPQDVRETPAESSSSAYGSGAGPKFSVDPTLKLVKTSDGEWASEDGVYTLSNAGYGTWVATGLNGRDHIADDRAKAMEWLRAEHRKDSLAKSHDTADEVTPEQGVRLIEGLKQIHQLEGARRFATPPAEVKDLQQIFDAMSGNDPAFWIEKHGNDSFTLSHNGKNVAYVFPKNGTGNGYYTDTTEFEKDGGGTLWYQALLLWAARNQKVLYPDVSLTHINTFRRTEQMLNGALRAGTTRWMRPRSDQRVYGWKDYPKTKEEDNQNLLRLALAVERNALENVPDLPDLGYNVKAAKFTRNGEEIAPDALRDLLVSREPREAGIGRSTLARAIVIRALRRGGQKPGGVEAAYRSLLELPVPDSPAGGTGPVLEGGAAGSPEGGVRGVEQVAAGESIFYSIDSPAFKKWFEGSRVVDEGGKPLRVYHGTGSDISVFSDNEDGNYANANVPQDGIWFASDPDRSEWFANVAARRRGGAANIMPVYLSIKNPYVYTAQQFADEGIAGMPEIYYLKQAGHDGAIVERGEYGEGEQWGEVQPVTSRDYVVFSPDQVKSAIGNDGEFDANNPDIRYSLNPLGRDKAGRFTFKTGEAIYRAVADVANKVLAKVHAKPMDEDLGRRYRQMNSVVQRAQDLTVDLADDFFKLTEDQRNMISDIVEGELAAGVTPPQELLDIATRITAAMNAQSDEMVRLGLIKQESADRWRGRYLPRFYEPKLRQNQDPWWTALTNMIRKPSALMGMKGKSFMGRGLRERIKVSKLNEMLAAGWEIRDEYYDPATSSNVTVWRDYTRAEREQMGEIRDAAFRFIMGYNASQQDIALGRLFEHLAADVAQDLQPTPDWVRVPDTLIEDTGVNRYGKLAGKYVPAEVFDHISKHDQSTELLKFYRTALSMWKEGKTVLNPVSHANNVLSNTTMAHFAGVSYWDAHKYVGTIRDFVKGSPMLDEAKEVGLFQGTLSREELVAVMPEQLRMLADMEQSKARGAVDKVWNALALWTRKPLGKAYEFEDLFFRYLIYRDARGRGMGPDDAVEYSQRYIFRYDDLPRGARAIRDTAIPFFAYTYKVVPVLAHTALVYPWRFAAPMAVMHGVNAVAYALAYGADDDDWQEKLRKYAMDAEYRKQINEEQALERKSLPPWLRGTSALLTPKAIRLGTDEKTNLPVFLDASRIIPGGDIFDVNSNSGGVPFLQNLTPSNPLFTAAGAMFLNRDAWFGKDILDPDDTRAEKAQKMGTWLWRQFTPALAVGNYHQERMGNVISNALDRDIPFFPNDFTGTGRDGLPVQPKYALPNLVGIKARPYDLEMSAEIEESKAKRLINLLKSEVRQIQRLEEIGAKSERQAEREIGYAEMKMDRLKDGLTVDGNDPDDEE